MKPRQALRKEERQTERERDRKKREKYSIYMYICNTFTILTFNPSNVVSRLKLKFNM